MRPHAPDVEDLFTALENLAQNGIPTPETLREFDVGTGPYLAYFEQEILDDLVGKGGSTCRFFEGIYGTGKTHLLRLLAEIGLARGLAVAWTDLSQALSLQHWDQIARHVLSNMTARIGGEPVRSLPRILARMAVAGQVNVDRLQKATLPHPGFQRAMALVATGYACDEETRELLSRYLLGEKVLVTHLRRVGIRNVKDPLTARNAEQILSTVTAALFHLGVPGTMLLFDEEDSTLATTSLRFNQKLSVSANLIRRLIDGCSTDGLVGTVAVFAVLPGFLNHCRTHYPALGQRIQLPRGEGVHPGWRWPVLTVGSVNATQDPEAFLQEVASRLARAAEACGADSLGLTEELLTQGREVLSQHVGSGFRRPLLKRLASLAIGRVG